MRVLFLTLYPDGAASPRYRVAQFLPYLRDNGIECTVASAVSEATYSNRGKRRAMAYHLHETQRRIRQVLAARNYDLVVLQKALMSAYLRGFDAFFHARVPRFLYDIDDAVHLAPPHSLPRVWRHLQDPVQVQTIMRRAHTVLAGNAWLAEQARAAGANASVFPTVVDTERFHPVATPPATFRIGWIGSPSTAPALDVVRAALNGLTECEISLIGPGDSCGIQKAQLAPWSLDREVELVQQCHVGIMPLIKNDWNRGKCALKALQYMACGVPCVATPFGAVTDIIRHDENGLFADSDDAWRDAFERLRDPVLRDRLGRAARATIDECFSLRNAAPRFKQILDDAALGGNV